ncbi:Na(+)/H(+) antiporter [Trichophyton mentagrophytes]|nr:Na(+)/H(+) antiporter [Trichophyton mentagrophytes]
MAWDHLDFDKPHLAYMILGGFTSLFMLCSLFVKEKLYIGEATVATLCGVIFGPHAANLFNPISWGNVDKLTLECSRIVLVVQCFAVGVELPKSYMERHWRSVVMLLLPIMTIGWLVTSLFIWWMIEPLSWLESLICAACVTATDPVLASSVVGKGKFAKRVPKHLRDVLSAESGCNDGMAFPFIYLSLYLMAYHSDRTKIAEHWIVVTILYECIFGAIFGFIIGYAGRHAIKFAESKKLIDRESFLVFYFVLALFCAGAGSSLGMDDLLIGFSAGIGFSNDGWFTEKTEESHVSNVIDLLLNLAYFVYFGAIIPWEQYNLPDLGLVPWRLVILAILVLCFRRIPAMLMMRPFIPDVKTWREALFAGHFGPIGVGAIFACILARAELETHSTQPLPELPEPGTKDYIIIYVIWPITTFLVITSIIVHGSSIAVFTLGKHINTLTLTMSYTQAHEDGPSWMNRLPRIQSTSKTSLSMRKDSWETTEKPEFPPGTLGPIGVPGNLLRRQMDDDPYSTPASRASSRKPSRRRKQGAQGAGGPISQSAITPQRRPEGELQVSKPPTPEAEASEDTRGRRQLFEGGQPTSPRAEVYQEGDDIIVEDEEGNVLEPDRVVKEKSSESSKPAGIDSKEGIMQKILPAWAGFGKTQKDESHPKVNRARRSARAYQFANTIIVEDEDGEVIKKYTIPSSPQKGTGAGAAGTEEEHPKLLRRITRLGTWTGDGAGESAAAAAKKAEEEDAGIRFTVPVSGDVDGHLRGRRMSKQDFINQMQHLGPKSPSDGSSKFSYIFRRDGNRGRANPHHSMPISGPHGGGAEGMPSPQEISEMLSQYTGAEGSATDNQRRILPDTVSRGSSLSRHDSEDDGTERIPPAHRRAIAAGQQPPDLHSPTVPSARSSKHVSKLDDDIETPAERKRRLAALGAYRSPSTQRESDSEDDGEPRVVKGKVQFADGTKPAKRKSPVQTTFSPSTGATSPDLPSSPPPVYAPESNPFSDDGNAPGSAAQSNNEGAGNDNGNDGRENTPRNGSKSKITWGGEIGR